jgi:hypothetical protein
MVQELGKEEGIDRSYYDRMVDEAIKSISQYGDFEWFVSREDIPPWEGEDEIFSNDKPWMDETITFDVR